jgi:transcriptional regulator GlxA family with amidase domain
MPPATLQIGVMFEAAQLSDISCIDILGNLSTVTVTALGPAAPRDLQENAIDITFHYISSSLDLAFMTPSMHAMPTTTYDTVPRNLDLLIIGGPLPSHRPDAADRFLKEAVGGKRVKTVLTTCTGSMWLASSGVLDGKRATTNRLFLPLARQLYPNVEWLDQRWVVDGNVWTSGGAAAGELELFF